MSDIAQAILQKMGLKSSAFPANSRYNAVETTSIEGKNGDPVVFLKRRFVPPAENFVLLQEHTVRESERLDHITAAYYGDPEKFWQICDANNTMHPGELTEETGSRIRITLPEGIPGNTNA